MTWIASYLLPLLLANQYPGEQGSFRPSLIVLHLGVGFINREALPCFLPSPNLNLLPRIEQGSTQLSTMKTEENVTVVDNKSPQYLHDKETSHSDPEYGGDIVVGNVEETKRGLKARHAQMIALGGTIGKIYISFSPAIQLY